MANSQTMFDSKPKSRYEICSTSEAASGAEVFKVFLILFLLCLFVDLNDFLLALKVFHLSLDTALKC